HANEVTMRAVIARADGSERRQIAPELSKEPGSWTQFAGFSPDGKTAVIGRGWRSEENAKWEEEHKNFRFTTDGSLYDVYFIDLKTGQSLNITGVERVSPYNNGVFFWPGKPEQLGFTAIIDGNSHPYRMDRDGRNKRDLTKDSKEFTYGFSGSPDGKRVAYHKNYKIYIADADGSNAVAVETGKSFNFCPYWSEDGKRLLFVSGEHYNCHPHVVNSDGTGLRKLADRGGYDGVVPFLDVPDFHGGSSDVPKWAVGGEAIYHTGKVGDNIELFRVTLDGKSEQLTTSPTGWTFYHPNPSADGEWLQYGSKRDGVRNLYVRRLRDGTEFPLTSVTAGHAAMWMHWQNPIE
ncbi:MAG: hypothetical protein AB7O26_20955, partial [Planctomycetaceae bacterium]